MIDDRERFDRAIALFEMPEPAYQRMLDRRDRRARTQRIAATAIGILVVAATAIFLGRSFVDGRTGRDVGTTPVETLDVRTDPGIHVAYALPEGWTSDDSAPDDLILDAGDGRSVIVSAHVWAGPRGCVATGSTGRGPRCRTNPAGIFAWLASRPSLEVTTGIRPVGIGGYDAFRLGVRTAGSETAAQPVLWRGTGDRAIPVVTLRPGTRLLLHLVVTDRDVFAVSIVSPAGDFDAFLADAEPVLASLEFAG